jgi:hypothetical protein
MKNIKDLIIEGNAYNRGLTQACKILTNILNNHSDESDTIIYNLLDNITDNGNDDLVIDNIKSWLDENK